MCYVREATATMVCRSSSSNKPVASLNIPVKQDGGNLKDAAKQEVNIGLQVRDTPSLGFYGGILTVEYTQITFSSQEREMLTKLAKC